LSLQFITIHNILEKIRLRKDVFQQFTNRQADDASQEASEGLDRSGCRSDGAASGSERVQFRALRRDQKAISDEFFGTQ
jgi:hypothetical protein